MLQGAPSFYGKKIKNDAPHASHTLNDTRTDARNAEDRQVVMQAPLATAYANSAELSWQAMSSASGYRVVVWTYVSGETVHTSNTTDTRVIVDDLLSC